MVEHCPKFRSAFSHFPGAAFAHAESVTTADTLKQDSCVHFLGSEAIAWNGIPSEPSPNIEAAVFSAKHHQRGVFAGHRAGPARAPDPEEELLPAFGFQCGDETATAGDGMNQSLSAPRSFKPDGVGHTSTNLRNLRLP
jgi:hypothetical protein